LQRGWEIDISAGLVRFAKKDEEALTIPKEKLIANSLAYARELEQIV
jgi:26S proteasome regulatory subunit N12